VNGQQRVCLLVGGLVAAILIATLGLASWTIPDRHVSYETNTLAEGAPVSSLPFQTTIDGNMSFYVYGGSLRVRCGGALRDQSSDDYSLSPTDLSSGYFPNGPCGSSRQHRRELLGGLLVLTALVCGGAFVVIGRAGRRDHRAGGIARRDGPHLRSPA